ncbi:hypothetical protein [Sorangium cellulosum]|uniref:hypothetical protein n=1 Tax=Sorangium cellulosum TaxID=56 RepID=UPI000CF50FBE|nr:hypothetical protein [Sorangium cellulosum]
MPERELSFTADARYRRGRPYTPLVSLQELDAGRVVPDARRTLLRQLTVRTGGVERFDPHDFVVVQEAAIRAWESLVRHVSTRRAGIRPDPGPGGWVEAARCRTS